MDTASHTWPQRKTMPTWAEERPCTLSRNTNKKLNQHEAHASFMIVPEKKPARKRGAKEYVAAGTGATASPAPGFGGVLPHSATAPPPAVANAGSASSAASREPGRGGSFI